MTNAHWDFSVEETRKACKLDKLMLLNDWESVAYSLPTLGDSELVRINDCQVAEEGNRALCGVGTGLGAAGLVRGLNGFWVPVAGEGGHVSFSPVDKDEADVLTILSKHQTQHISFERLLSGKGMTTLHSTIVDLFYGGACEQLAPSEIVARATRKSDEACDHTIRIFCGILGNFAGNLCLTLGAQGGVYLGGGVVQKISEAGLFDEARFLRRLIDKGRLSKFLSDIPAFIIQSQYAGLVGAARALGVEHAHIEGL